MADALTAQGLDAVGVATDIASEAGTCAMAQAALDRFGTIDVLINNASLMSVLERRSWLEIPLDEWDQVMAVNLRGMFLCCRAVFPAMKQRGRGKIVNISSARVWEGTPNRLHYTTSKAGVIGFTRALAREVAADGITVNAVTPGLTQSETQVASSSGKLSRRADRRPRHRTGPGARRPGGRGDVSVLGGERFHDRADHQRRRRQGHALRADPRLGLAIPGKFDPCHLFQSPSLRADAGFPTPSRIGMRRTSHNGQSHRH